ncbi:hypothetical protein D5663_14725, partial [Enterococcus faecalis]|nr:hypothetical protein [Enterococcus faecalis]
MRNYNYKMTVLKMLLLTLISCLFLVCIFMKNSIVSDLSNTFFGISIPYLLSSLIDLSDNESWKNSQRKLKRAGLIHNETKIR